MAALIGFLWLVPAAQPVRAHPHVFVNAKAEIIYDGRGQVVAINHVWTFDEAYSAFATMGFPKGPDGRFLPEKLAELAKVNVESLQDFGYFTDAKAEGRRVAFKEPINYRLEHHETALTLFMTLPLVRPASGRTFSLEVSDPSFFVAFSFDDAADAVALSQAPQGCVTRVRRPRFEDLTRFMGLAESAFQAIAGTTQVSGAFQNRAMVACP